MYGKKSFGTALRGLRQRGRLTTEELAEASGVSARAAARSSGRSRRPVRGRGRRPPALAELVGELARAPLVALDQAGDLFAERLPRATKDRTDHAPDSAPG